MKKFVFIATLLLAGCGQSTTSNVDAVVAEVKKLTVQICQFLPTDQTVVKLITADPLGAGALAVATAICQAVTAPVPKATGQQQDKMKPCPMVSGICIEGQFVPKA